MKSWTVQGASEHFSEFVDACLAEGPQLLTNDGTGIAVLMPVVEWQRRRAMSGPSLKELLLTSMARTDHLADANLNQTG